MKKKLSILIALVMAISLCLVTAVPVSAASSPDSNLSYTSVAADPLIYALIDSDPEIDTFDEAAATFASGDTNCEVKNLAVSGPAVVGSPVTVTGTVDMTAWVQCIGWDVEVWAESLAYAAVTDTPGSFSAGVDCSGSECIWTIAGALDSEESPWKWSDHVVEVDGWAFHVDTNDESQVFDFSITFTPGHTGEYTLFAGGRVNAGYYSDSRGEPWTWFPKTDYGEGGGVTVGCEDSLTFEVVEVPNTVVGLTADVEDIVGINVAPTDINFGTLKPGETSVVFDITVESIGTHTVDVDAKVDAQTSTHLFYDNLQMYYSDSWTTGPNWDNIVTGLAMGKSQVTNTRLLVPLGYTPKGVETGTLTFIATPK